MLLMMRSVDQDSHKRRTDTNTEKMYLAVHNLKQTDKIIETC